MASWPEGRRSSRGCSDNLGDGSHSNAGSVRASVAAVAMLEAFVLPSAWGQIGGIVLGRSSE
jgi:hypothetical protein